MKRLTALLLCCMILTGCGSLHSSTQEPVEACSLLDLKTDLEEKYGLEILWGQEAAALHPQDYTFTPETDEAVIYDQLQMLKDLLKVYPKGMVELLSRDCGGLTLALVQKIQGADAGSLETARGLQFSQPEGGTVIVLAKDLERTLYHELYHVMEDFIIPRSQALDHWEQFNPPDFSYDGHWEDFRNREPSPWLEEDSRVFIDSYSMTFPREDRARIMEFAMLPGKEAYFQTDTMQKKLSSLCAGIREAFGLQKIPEKFLWEQYLK